MVRASSSYKRTLISTLCRSVALNRISRLPIARQTPGNMLAIFDQSPTATFVDFANRNPSTMGSQTWIPFLKSKEAVRADSIGGLLLTPPGTWAKPSGSESRPAKPPRQLRMRLELVYLRYLSVFERSHARFQT